MLLRAGVRGHVARLKCSGSQPVPFQTLCTWSNHRGLENIAIYMSGSSLVIQMVKTLPAVHIGDPGDPCSILGSERSPEEGNGNPLQYSYLENQWTEKPGGLRSTELQRDTTVSKHVHTLAGGERRSEVPCLWGRCWDRSGRYMRGP